MEGNLTVEELLYRLKDFPSDSEVCIQPTGDLGDSKKAVNVALIDGKVFIL